MIVQLYIHIEKRLTNEEIYELHELGEDVSYMQNPKEQKIYFCFEVEDREQAIVEATGILKKLGWEYSRIDLVPQKQTEEEIAGSKEIVK